MEELFGVNGRRLAIRCLLLPILFMLSAMELGQGPASTGATGATGAGAVPASRQATNIAVITIKDEINQTTLRSVSRRLRLAERAGADAVVFELDTPGGELYSVLGICNAIKGSPIKNTVAWVNRNAYSGGAIIALACREIVVNDPATLGDALPIQSSFGMINSMPEHERQKFLSPLIAELVDSARRNGYDELLVQGIASRGVELWLVENSATHQRMCITRDEYKLIFDAEPVAGSPVLASAPEGPNQAEGPNSRWLGNWENLGKKSNRKGQGGPGRATKNAAPEDPNNPNKYIPAAPTMSPMSGDVTALQELPPARPLLGASDVGKWTLVEYVASGAGPFIFKTEEMKRYGLSKGVVRDDQELLTYFGAKNLLRLNQSWSEGMVALLTLFPVRGLLIAIFLIALFIEMTHPGMIAPGAIAAVALVALIAPPLLINMASWWEVAAIIAGIVLIALEIFVIPGFGVAGILGIILLFGGLIGTFVPQGSIFPNTAKAQNDMLYGVATLVMSLATSGVAMYFISKHFKSLPLFGRLVLKDPTTNDEDLGSDMLAAMAEAAGPVKRGMTGTALTPLRPAGRVELGGPGGRIVDVVAELGFIPAGAKVRVTNVSDFRIGVELVEA